MIVEESIVVDGPAQAGSSHMIWIRAGERPVQSFGDRLGDRPSTAGSDGRGGRGASTRLDIAAPLPTFVLASYDVNGEAVGLSWAVAHSPHRIDLVAAVRERSWVLDLNVARHAENGSTRRYRQRPIRTPHHGYGRSHVCRCGARRRAPGTCAVPYCRVVRPSGAQARSHTSVSCSAPA